MFKFIALGIFATFFVPGAFFVFGHHVAQSNFEADCKKKNVVIIGGKQYLCAKILRIEKIQPQKETKKSKEFDI